MKKNILILPILLLLSSCAQMNSQFDCPMKPGIRCESIDSMNKRVDRGEVGSTKVFSNDGVHQIHFSKNFKLANTSYLSKEEPIRYLETIQRVWVAPFEDKEGNYHQESDIYTVTKPGSWIEAPLKEMNEDGE